MKTSKTMRLTLVGAAACSFFFGLGQYEITAITNCQNSCCENEYSWWTGTYTFSAQTTTTTKYPFAPGQNVKTAVPTIWVDVPSNGGCQLQFWGNYSRWSWPSSNGTCFDPVTGKPQAPQGVSPTGIPSPPSPPGTTSRGNICGTPR